MRRRLALLALPLLLALPGCDGSLDAAPPVPAAMLLATPGLPDAQRLRADRLVSIFENDTMELQYGYVEDLGDGRGFTCGRDGFTTANGDALDVVEAYAARVPNTPLARFLPALRTLAREESDDVAALSGFPEAWTAAAQDARFREAQDAEVDALYYGPAMQHADALGLRTALGRFVLYDAIVQHGEGDDPDGLPALIERASRRTTPPSRGGSEAAWIARFLLGRLRTLAHAHDPATREAWAASTDRVAVQAAFLREGRYDLAGPLPVSSTSFHFVVP